jgi:hypothetical protein
MTSGDEQEWIHSLGEGVTETEGLPSVHRVETFDGPVQMKWVDEAGMSMQGPLAYFVDFLKVSGVWERFVAECPLRHSSPNAPAKNEILGTIPCIVLSGHRRYAHIRAIRSDDVLPGLLGIERFRSKDGVRRVFEKQYEEALTLWMDRFINETYAVLVDQQWILDLDPTVKTLYGRQVESRVG